MRPIVVTVRFLRTLRLMKGTQYNQTSVFVMVIAKADLQFSLSK